MARTSAGILLYRVVADGGIEVLLVHPGGPFWKNKGGGVWSIPKGEFDPEEEDALAAARREFTEELGRPAPSGDPIGLGEVTQKGGKQVFAFGYHGDLDPDAVVSNTFVIEWPPRSGRTAEFPEVDRAAWLSLVEAQELINEAQRAFLDRLGSALGGSFGG